MVDFHDRRTARVDSVDGLLPNLNLQPGDTVSKQVIDGRFVVKGQRTEQGRRFVIHEALPNGNVIQRGEPFDKRYQAKNAAAALPPTSVYKI